MNTEMTQNMASRLASGCAPFDKFSLTAKRYRDAAAAYQALADELGIIPQQVQAITWLRVHRTAEVN